MLKKLILQAMKRLILFSILIVAMLFSRLTFAQLTHFSQYYSSPTTLGPSFAGLNRQSKAVINYRDQWPNIPGKFVTYAIAVDHFIDKRNSGVGMSIFRDEAGTGKLRVTEVALHYCYDFKMTRNLHSRPGASIKFNQRGLNFRDLTFSDQYLGSLDGTPLATSTENPTVDHKGYVDAAMSWLVYGKKFWAGVTVDHLMRPNQSLYEEDSRVNLLFTSYGGYKMQLKDKKRRRIKDESLTFSYRFKMQGSFKTMDMGASWTKKDFTAGVYYRGMPYLNNDEKGYKNSDALILLVGYKFYSLSVGYSYDITVNKELMGSAGGAHEISLIYDFSIGKRPAKNKKHTPIPCPGF